MGNEFVKEAFTLLGFAIVTIVLRCYARWRSVGLHGLAWDDYLMLVAGVVYTLETVAAYSVGAKFLGLANNSMSDEQRQRIVPNSKEWNLRVGGSKTQVIGWSLYTLLLWLLKLCINNFYSRLAEGVPRMQIRIKIGFAAIAASYVAVVLSILLGCRPLRKNWQINPNPGIQCLPAISPINLYVTLILNVVTDVYLMSIPLPVLWKANIPTRRKWLLLVMFSGGIFVIMAGILRCALILTAATNGAQQAGSWACRETFVAVVIGNVPMIYSLLQRLPARLRQLNWISSRFLPSALSGKTSGGDSQSVQLSQRRASRRQPFASLFSRTGGQLTSNSAERIVEHDVEADGSTAAVTATASASASPSTAASTTAAAAAAPEEGITVATENIVAILPSQTEDDVEPHGKPFDYGAVASRSCWVSVGDAASRLKDEERGHAHQHR